METTIETKNLEAIENAILEGGKLHGFRSGGGLRVIRMENGNNLIGYGEHPDALVALKYTNDDLLAGGRKYSEVYGEIYPHYLTGSLTPSCEFDRWLLAGHTVDAILDDGEIKVTLSGIKIFRTPKEITERVLENNKAEDFENRGFVYRTTPGNWFNGDQGVSTSVIKSPKGEKDPWHYDIIKEGKGKSLMLAILNATEAEEKEI